VVSAYPSVAPFCLASLPVGRPAGRAGPAGDGPGGAGRGLAGDSGVPRAVRTSPGPPSGAGGGGAGGSGLRASAAVSNGRVSSAEDSSDPGRPVPAGLIRRGGRRSPTASSSPQPRKAPQAGLRQNGSGPALRNPHEGQTLIRRAPPHGLPRRSSRRSSLHQPRAPARPAWQATSRPSIQHPLPGRSPRSQPDRTLPSLCTGLSQLPRGPCPHGLASILDG
jgi:hypothetical protein